MEPLAEAKPQRWRVVAEMGRGTYALLYLGMSITQVRENLHEPWKNYFTEEDRKKTKRLLIQKWVGAADKGRWNTHCDTPMPKVTEI